MPALPQARDGMEQTANIPLCGIMTNLIRKRIIFLSSIFLSSECFLRDDSAMLIERSDKSKDSEIESLT